MSTSNTVTKNDLKAILESVSMPKSEKRVLLWTNPSPTSEYGSGNPVSASVATQYDFIEVEFLLWTGYQYICCTDRAALGESVITTEIASSNNYAIGSQICPLARSWNFLSNSGVTFNTAVQANFASGGTWQAANGVLIPYKIYGIKGGSTDGADYIVEQGTSGIWTYRKWNSGISECWGKYSLSFTSMNAWGSVYYSEPQTSVDFPTNLFTSVPSVQITRSGGTEGWAGVNQVEASRIFHLYFIRPTTTDAAATQLDIYARGRWK